MPMGVILIFFVVVLNEDGIVRMLYIAVHLVNDGITPGFSGGQLLSSVLDVCDLSRLSQGGLD